MVNKIPNWSEQAQFYHIYPLGMLGAPAYNHFRQPENKLDSLGNWIAHIKAMGLNALYLGPLFESSQHGYDTADYFNVDRRLGTNKDLKELSRKLHKEGIKLVLDAVFHHVGRDFWAFKDLQACGKASRFADWFCAVIFDEQSPYGDLFSYEGWNGHFNLVKLNLKNKDVRQHLFAAVGFWINEFAIDGLRLDVAESLDEDFVIELAAFCRASHDDFWLVGEMIHGDYNRLVSPERLDSVTNYELYKGLYSSHNDHNYFEVAYSLNRQFGEAGIYQELLLYNFADNHDVTRVASVLKNEDHLFPLYLLLFTIPGIPSVYYGSEWAIKGVRSADDDTMLRPQINITPDHGSPPIFHFICELIRVRKQHPALWKGSYRQAYVKHEVMAFCRQTAGDLIIVAVNASASQVFITIALSTNEAGLYEDALNSRYTAGTDQLDIISIDVPANGGRIMKRIAGPALSVVS